MHFQMTKKKHNRNQNTTVIEVNIIQTSQLAKLNISTVMGVFLHMATWGPLVF